MERMGSNMPRGIKGSGTPKIKKAIDDRIAAIEAEIEGHKAAIEKLAGDRKELIAEKRRETTNELLKVIEQSGMSPEQLLELVSGAK